MGVFKIPKNICKEITDAMSAFWWGDTEEQKRMHWSAWWKEVWDSESYAYKTNLEASV
jgi:hypothetical protein